MPDKKECFMKKFLPDKAMEFKKCLNPLYKVSRRKKWIQLLGKLSPMFKASPSKKVKKSSVRRK